MKQVHLQETSNHQIGAIKLVPPAQQFKEVCSDFFLVPPKIREIKGHLEPLGPEPMGTEAKVSHEDFVFHPAGATRGQFLNVFGLEESLSTCAYTSQIPSVLMA